MQKTKVMHFGVGLMNNSSHWEVPYNTLCSKGVIFKSIHYTVCITWVHKRCIGFGRKLRAEDELEFKCRKCDNGGNLVHPEAKFVELDDGSKFQCVDQFCKIGDILSAGGGAEEAANTRVLSTCCKFNEVAPMLMNR